MGNERAAWEVLRVLSPLPKSRGGYLGAWRVGGENLSCKAAMSGANKSSLRTRTHMHTEINYVVANRISLTWCFSALLQP